MWEERLKAELILLRAEGRRLLPIKAGKPPYVFIDNRAYIDFTNWDIFNIGGHREFKKAHVELAGHGVGRVSPIRGGWTRYHQIAESVLASFLGFEDAVIFPSRRQAIFSFLVNTIHEQDLLFLNDRLSSSTIADAAELVRVPAVHYSVDDLNRLARKLFEQNHLGECFLWIEAFAPELGLVAPLRDIESCIIGRGSRLGSKAQLVVDESYTMGILGRNRAGLVGACSLQPSTAAIVGGVFPSFGFGAGVVAGSTTLCNLIRIKSNTILKDVGLLASIAASIPVAIELLKDLSEEFDRIKSLSLILEAGLSELGFVVRSHPDLSIVSVVVPPSISIRWAWETLMHGGVFCDFDETNFRGNHVQLIRFLITSKHQFEHVSRVLELMSGIARSLPVSAD